MFNTLIESSSHVREYKRRGSFLLFTTFVYMVLVAVFGVVGIYAYDAKLEKQSLEFVTLMSLPMTVDANQARAVDQHSRPQSTSDKSDAVPERETPMVDVDRPEVAPEGVSTAPNKNLPRPSTGPLGWGHPSTIVNDGGGGMPPGPSGYVVQGGREVKLPDNPPPPEPPREPKVVSRGVITGNAISLPKPVYSEIAKRMRVEGVVRVQVLVDLDGRVVSASVLNGSPYLRVEAQKAAMQARFSPTLLNDQPVKVSGIIIYNFQLGP